jgi:hypothetical protein
MRHTHIYSTRRMCVCMPACMCNACIYVRACVCINGTSFPIILFHALRFFVPFFFFQSSFCVVSFVEAELFTSVPGMEVHQVGSPDTTERFQFCQSLKQTGKLPARDPVRPVAPHISLKCQNW